MNHGKKVFKINKTFSRLGDINLSKLVYKYNISYTITKVKKAGGLIFSNFTRNCMSVATPK